MRVRANNPHGGGIIILMSILVAMGLNLLPLPSSVAVNNPDWVLLCLVYWALALPERVGVVSAWCVGLIMDVLTAHLMGQHAMAYALVIYLCIRIHRRMRLYPPVQQAVSVFFYLGGSQVFLFWTGRLQGSQEKPAIAWFAIVLGAIMWFPVLFGLRRLRRHFSIT
jgi:rod shape-determining protein MreD